MSDDQLVDSFVQFHEVEKNSSPRTLRNYSQALAAFQNFLGEKFPGWKSCLPDDFRAYLFQCMKDEVSRSTIRLRYSALRSFYKYLVHRHGLSRKKTSSSIKPETDHRATRNPTKNGVR